MNVALAAIGLGALLYFARQKQKSTATGGVVMLEPGVEYRFTLEGVLPWSMENESPAEGVKKALETSGAWDIQLAPTSADGHIVCKFTRTVTGRTPVVLGSLQHGLQIASITRLDGAAL